MTTPAFEPARIECVRGIPVIAITRRLDTTNAPLFDAQAGPLLAEARSRILHDVYSDRETALNGSSA